MGFPLRMVVRRPKAPEAALLGLLRGVPLPPETEKAWPEVLALAKAHGVAALLHAVAAELPERAREDLRRARNTAQAARGWQQAAVLRFSAALEGAGALVVHAAAHAEDLYPSAELRPLTDLEMLIAPSRTFAALERLSRRGYRIEERPEKGWLVLRLRDPREGRVAIQLRRGFPPPAGAPPGPRAPAAAEPEVRSALPVGSLFLRAQGTRLHPDDAILVHALRLSEQGWRAPLIELVDLAHLFHRCDPATTVARARHARLLPQVGAALLLLDRCAAGAKRFGGAEFDPGRVPHMDVDVPKDLQRAVDEFELATGGDRPGALHLVARALGLVAQPGAVE